MDCPTTKPADHGGFGQQSGPYGGLHYREFRCYCPPDIQPSTRLIAVCGVNDFSDAASPVNDGWFLSDFYLFHHLFQGIGANQIWLTCLDPNELVSKYTEYAHGNPMETRRIVLDRAMLPAVLSPGNIRVVPSEILRERFLATVRSECRIAAQLGQPVLLLIFGHGDSDDYGVTLGCGRDGKDTAVEFQLKISSVKRAIGRGVEVGAMLTSCFSGGWVMSPDLNMTLMTAAGVKNESESWPRSVSSGRATGSIYSSAVLQALVKLEEDGESNARDEALSSSTYAELSRIIYSTLVEDIDRLGTEHQVKFSAHDDLWETEWRTRSGIPLVSYKERWEMLQCIPVDTADPSTNRFLKNPAFGTSLSTHTSATTGGLVQMNKGLHGGSSQRGLRRIVETHAGRYLRSYPGRDSYGTNSVHWQLRELLRGGVFDITRLEMLSDTLIYRMSMMNLATDYKDFLGLQFPDCTMCDTDAWRDEHHYRARQRDEAGQLAGEKLQRFEDIENLLLWKPWVFDKPLPEQGRAFLKPTRYLAIALCESDMPLERIEVELKKIREWKQKKIAKLSATFKQDRTVRKLVNAIVEKFGTARERLRSLSPRKKDRGQPTQEIEDTLPKVFSPRLEATVETTRGCGNKVV